MNLCFMKYYFFFLFFSITNQQISFELTFHLSILIINKKHFVYQTHYLKIILQNKITSFSMVCDFDYSPKKENMN